jgi:hypothetical protein
MSARRRETPRRRLRLGASSAKGRCRLSFAGCGFLHWDGTPQWSDADRLRRSQQSAATRHRLLMRRFAPQPAALRRHQLGALVAPARFCAHWRRSAPQPAALRRHRNVRRSSPPCACGNTAALRRHRLAAFIAAARLCAQSRRSAPQPAALRRHRIAAFIAAARFCAHWRRFAPQPAALRRHRH